ncbi:hypothetical protein [Stenotrophomonas maltophilia]|uniref:hypothetical protein n=1 Tax=Stenotrophomonas maltophilia TaxID=40324 RepID=UPI0039C01A5D
MKKFTFEVVKAAEVLMIGEISVESEDEAGARDLVLESDWENKVFWDFGPGMHFVGDLDEDDLELLRMEEMVDGEGVA